jgi:uncharacterized protein YkwD
MRWATPYAVIITVIVAAAAPACKSPDPAPPAAAQPGEPGRTNERFDDRTAADPEPTRAPLVAENAQDRAEPSDPRPTADRADIPPAAPAGGLSAMEAEIAAEIRALRANPAGYAAHLREYRRFYGTDNVIRRPNRTDVRTREGIAAVDEAIAALEKSPKLPPLELSPGISRAARDHADDIGRSGSTSHTGSDGSQFWDRMERYGEWTGDSGENIMFGSSEARTVVMDLLIDDGVPSRGHRQNLLSRKFAVFGVGCAPHKVWRLVCTMDFASGFRER